MRSKVPSFLGRILVLLAVVCPAWPQSPAPSEPYQQALSCVQRGQIGPAITLLQQILLTSPTDLRAHNLMGIALTASGKLEDANTHFRAAIELNPKFYPALKNLGLNELALKRPDEAKAHLEQVLQFAPQDRAVHLSLGEVYFARREFAPAVEHYLKSGGLFLKDPQTILNFAASCFESHQEAKAAGALEVLGPGADATAHLQAGLMLARLGKYDAAARHFEIARKDYPDRYQIGFNLTLAYVKNGNYAGAIRVGNELLSQGYRKAELYNLLSEAYEGSSETVKAYDALRTATQIDPQDENNYLDLVALGIDHKNFELASGIADIGLQNIPHSYRLLLERGAVRAFRGQLAQAMDDFELASKLDTQKNLPYYAMSMALMQRDQMGKAIEILRRRLAVSPDDYLMLYALGEGLNRAGLTRGSREEREATRALERSIRLNPEFPHSRVILGRMLLKRGDLDRAIIELEKALELDPADQTPSYQLALAYRKKGDSQRADDLMAKFERFKAEDRERFSNRNVLRILRQGEQ